MLGTRPPEVHWEHRNSGLDKDCACLDFREPAPTVAVESAAVHTRHLEGFEDREEVHLGKAQSSTRFAGIAKFEDLWGNHTRKSRVPAGFRRWIEAGAAGARMIQ